MTRLPILFVLSIIHECIDGNFVDRYLVTSCKAVLGTVQIDLKIVVMVDGFTSDSLPIRACMDGSFVLLLFIQSCLN